MSRRARACAVTVASLVGALAWACGGNVDLGGTMGDDASAAGDALDGAPFDVGADGDTAPNQECEPCRTSSQCASTAACTPLSADAGNTYCVARCPSGTGCNPDDTCRMATSTEGSSLRACIPNAGVCPIAAPPAAPDGAPLERCGALVGPALDAGCRDCRYECQANGCYGGWWCDTATHDCVRPPKTCL